MTTESESHGGGISLFILLIESSSEATEERLRMEGESVIFAAGLESNMERMLCFLMRLYGGFRDFWGHLLGEARN